MNPCGKNGTSSNMSLQVYCAVGDVQKVMASNTAGKQTTGAVSVSWAGM